MIRSTLFFNILHNFKDLSSFEEEFIQKKNQNLQKQIITILIFKDKKD